ncbi:hypothetical protein BGZ95_003010 [Linnemannia exigua]|uniref:Uncharacterized protein n=1 Tax=Linnemannia exigua TaxID=604196 RepID=A0AAD4D6X0_9FUNG|nr:hypothetical protein BGZ95_003010 [Linnemannia exigua]
MSMSFKPTLMMLLALVVLLVVAVVQTEAVTVPIWCVCGNTEHTRLLCSFGGNWDGGSCGMITTRAYENFIAICKNDKSYKGTPHCWN